MATLRDIRRRIRSVESTQKITRAMKLVAAAKLRRAQERIVAPPPYAGRMAGVAGLLMLNADSRWVAARPPPRAQLLPIPRAEPGEGSTPPTVDYIYEPAPAAILGDLLPRHVRTQVFRALMESLAGEYGAR